MSDLPDEKSPMLEQLSLDDFAGRTGEVFTIVLDAGEALELKLAETRQLGGETVPDSPRAPFALIFRGGPPDRYLPQRIYDLEHPEIGRLSIFLVPLGPDREGMRYEAVFT